MAPRTSYRGGPLLALCAVLGLWIAARMVLAQYDGVFRYVEAASSPDPSAFSERLASRVKVRRNAPPNERRPTGYPILVPPPRVSVESRPAPWAAPSLKLSPEVPQREDALETGTPVGTAAGHQMLWMAALSHLPLPAAFSIERERKAAPVLAPFYPAGRAPEGADNRWSADSWLLLRRGGAGPIVTGAAPATYGASQMGAVLRYRIAPRSEHRPAAYLRATAAVESIREKEVAVGLSARPLTSVPVRAAIELRVSDQSGEQQVRPAAMVITEVQPIDLGKDIRAEFYGQAGYVGGNFATAFADGQLRVDASVADVGKGRIRAGAGTWVGAQDGASRMDIGPSATVSIPIGTHGSARLALDWRMRVSGNAEPNSGPALTLSAGF